MTRIDFHTRVADKLLYTCQLVRKAANGGWQVAILCSDDSELERIDDSLWTFSDNDFLPHVRVGDPLASRTPIVLSCSASDALPHHGVLVNLTMETPPHFARFERLLEVVSADETEVQAGRQRYAYYKQRGYPLEHYDRSRE